MIVAVTLESTRRLIKFLVFQFSLPHMTVEPLFSKGLTRQGTALESLTELEEGHEVAYGSNVRL